MARMRPIAVWDGEAFVPEARFKWQCDQDYVVGQKYQLDVFEERSIASHNHYMVSVEKAWDNLREGNDMRFPSPKHLRTWALVQTGYYHEDTTVCDTKRDAMTMAAIMRKLDRFSVISLRGNVVLRWTAQSQSLQAMDKDVFQKSKADVLDLLASMIGVTRKQLEKQR